MTDLQIRKLIKDRLFNEEYGQAKLVETHISWVLLAQDFVFKIKKPLYYSFLDFSTLTKRKFYCEHELKLNQRLTDGMYLDTVPICKKRDQIIIGADNGEIIDYAVKMKRMDETCQMNLLLKKGEVTFEHLDQLATLLAIFHKKADIIKTSINTATLQKDFADILKTSKFIENNIGKHEANIIKHSVAFSETFLKENASRISKRHLDGFTIDGHGDLYSQNIFLPESGEPVVFDCIEFSDHLRQVDVLNELAFFCMDLDYYGRPELAEYFLDKYNTGNPCLFNQEDHNLFNYYKLYRANVRAKVGALKAMQVTDKTLLKKQLKFVGNYLSLMERYMQEFYTGTKEATLQDERTEIIK